MTTASKVKSERHFRALFQELSRLETDCKILKQWANERGLAPAHTLAVLIGDSLESLGLHLSDFRHLLEGDKQGSIKKTEIYSEGAD